MKRDLYSALLDWKASARRKPLILRGVRQVGKTYLLQEFGKNEYDEVVHINFEEEEGLSELFRGSLAPEGILEKLSVFSGKKIRPGSTLLIFDEIQASNDALNSLKYFCEKAGEYHIVSAGSLLGVKLSEIKSFPVGKVNFLDLYPFHFLEFLEAIGKKELREMLEQTEKVLPLPEIFHRELIELLKRYYFVGGMPEAVSSFAEKGDWGEIRVIHNEIIRSYELDFAKHAPTTDIPKLSQVWNSIHSQLARENKKFLFTALKKSARGREFENAIQWLQDAGLVYPCRNTTTAKAPLSGYVNLGIFKLYHADIGLLGAMSKLPAEVLVQGNRLFEEFHGAFVENYVAQQLLTGLGQDLYYWTSSGKKAEIDFLIETFSEIYPLEVKAGVNPRSKSLRSFEEKFHPPLLLRTNLLNLKAQESILNIPLYMIQLLPRLISSFLT